MARGHSQMSRGSAGAYFADHPRLEHESAALRDGRLWRKAGIRRTDESQLTTFSRLLPVGADDRGILFTGA